MRRKLFFSYIFVMIILLNGCGKIQSGNEEKCINESEEGVTNGELNSFGKGNIEYSIFYGTWEFEDVVSMHSRLGGDEGYKNILGEQITLSKDTYETDGHIFENPEYLISMYPIEMDYNYFFEEQIDIKELLPDQKYFTIVQVVNKPIIQEVEYNGTTLIIKDDSTLYAFDYNCIYELKRINYIDGYEAHETFQERW